MSLVPLNSGHLSGMSPSQFPLLPVQPLEHPELPPAEQDQAMPVAALSPVRPLSPIGYLPPLDLPSPHHLDTFDSSADAVPPLSPLAALPAALSPTQSRPPSQLAPQTAFRLMQAAASSSSANDNTTVRGKRLLPKPDDAGPAAAVEGDPAPPKKKQKFSAITVSDDETEDLPAPTAAAAASSSSSTSEKQLKPVPAATADASPEDPSKDSKNNSTAFDGEKRVTVRNKVTQEVCAGSAAPKQKNLKAFLAQHPECEVYDGQTALLPPDKIPVIISDKTGKAIYSTSFSSENALKDFVKKNPNYEISLLQSLPVPPQESSTRVPAAAAAAAAAGAGAMATPHRTNRVHSNVGETNNITQNASLSLQQEQKKEFDAAQQQQQQTQQQAVLHQQNIALQQQIALLKQQVEQAQLQYRFENAQMLQQMALQQQMAAQHQNQQASIRQAQAAVDLILTTLAASAPAPVLALMPYQAMPAMHPSLLSLLAAGRPQPQQLLPPPNPLPGPAPAPAATAASASHTPPTVPPPKGIPIYAAELAALESMGIRVPSSN